MNTMNMPGFTAEASLYRNKSEYPYGFHEIGTHNDPVVLPALFDRFFRGICGGGVMISCIGSGDYAECLRRGFRSCDGE